MTSLRSSALSSPPLADRLLDQQTSVLGFFRSDRRDGGLALSEEDRAFLKLEFRRAFHAALLISAVRPHTASFFVPEANGAIGAGAVAVRVFRSIARSLRPWL